MCYSKYKNIKSEINLVENMSTGNRRNTVIAFRILV